MAATWHLFQKDKAWRIVCQVVMAQYSFGPADDSESFFKSLDWLGHAQHAAKDPGPLECCF